MTINHRIRVQPTTFSHQEYLDVSNDKRSNKERRVEIISKINVFQKSIFRIEEVHLRHERFDGTMSAEFMRLSLNRGDSVAALLHDVEENIIILTRQFRYPAYEKGPGWLIELPAGIVNTEIDATPEVTMQREILEEIGYSIQALQHISTFYPSPGGSSERIHLYYAQVTPDNCVAQGGGLVESGEDIQRLALPVDEAMSKITTGEIVDAKTIIGLQWLQARRSH